MTDRVLAWPPLVNVTTWSLESAGLLTQTTLPNVLSASAWPLANLALLFPFSLAEPTVFRKGFLVNGGTVAGNVDIGIYADVADTTLRLLVAGGGTAQAGVSTVQEVDFTDTLLGPGTFYAALVCSSTSALVYAVAGLTAGNYKAMGLLEAASAYPLPATLSPSRSTRTYLPLFGVSTRNFV